MTHGLGRIEHPETYQARALYPVTPLLPATTATRKYYWEGGAWLDQGQTGTCVGNAFSHRLADSPNPKTGIDETYARELYFDASGDSTYQQGTSGLAACRAMMTEGTISAYHWVTTADELKTTVLELGSVCVGIDWYNSMFDPAPLYSNAYLTVNPASGLAGGHELVVNGVNLAPTYGEPFYRLKNSWGRGWGHYGTARILCADLEELLFGSGGDAVLITESP